MNRVSEMDVGYLYVDLTECGLEVSQQLQG